jgi:cold shock protein
VWPWVPQRFAQVIEGKVKSFNAAKRYGFIHLHPGTKDIFFHLSQVKTQDLSSLRKGQWVSFEIADHKGKKIAKNLCFEKANSTIGSQFNPPASDQTQPKLIAIEALEAVLASAIRESNVGCKDFIGLFIQPLVPYPRSGPNWAIRGIKYGSANRAQCDISISEIVKKMQLDFVIPSEPI